MRHFESSCPRSRLNTVNGFVFTLRDRLDDAATEASSRWGDWEGRANLAFDSAEFTENGVVGDPREASIDLGEELLDNETNR